jgi:hypothetical protein
MEKIMSKTDRRTKIVHAQQTSEDRELTAAELDSVNGGMLFLHPPPSMSLAEVCLEAVKVGLTDCIGTLGSLGAPPKA